MIFLPGLPVDAQRDLEDLVWFDKIVQRSGRLGRHDWEMLMGNAMECISERRCSIIDHHPKRAVSVWTSLKVEQDVVRYQFIDIQP